MAGGYRFDGGADMRKALNALASKLGTGGEVRVGFLEGATYPADPKRKKTLPVATVAFWDEFGTVTSPPRPFFRGMIDRESPTWGVKLARVAKATNYDRKHTFSLMGAHIKDALQKSIVDFRDPPNAPSTVRRKGFNKPLIDQGIMQRAVDFEVSGV